MSRYAKWAQREHSEATRIAVTLPAGPVFLGLLPFLVAGVGPRLDRRLGLPPLRIGRVNRILGGLLTVLGFSLGFWSVNTQLTRGRGTPLPVMPTQELLTEGPFRYCRNPMTLGTILAYLGIGGRRGDDRRHGPRPLLGRLPAGLPQAPRGGGVGREVRRGLSGVQARDALHHPAASESGGDHEGWTCRRPTPWPPGPRRATG